MAFYDSFGSITLYLIDWNWVNSVLDMKMVWNLKGFL